MGLLINLLADAADRLRGCRVKHAGKIIHVSRGLELFDWLGEKRSGKTGQRPNAHCCLPDSVRSHSSPIICRRMTLQICNTALSSPAPALQYAMEECHF